MFGVILFLIILLFCCAPFLTILWLAIVGLLGTLATLLDIIGLCPVWFREFTDELYDSVSK